MSEGGCRACAQTGCFVSLLLPMHNEAACIPELIERSVRTLDLWQKERPAARRFEILAVDDASDDGSRDVLAALAADDGRLRPIFLEHRSGQCGAFAAGFAAAEGDITVTMDADLQCFPEDIPFLVEPLESGLYDVCNAIRSRRRHAPGARFVSSLGLVLLRLMVQCPVQDPGSNFTAVRTHLVRGLPLLRNDHRYLIPILLRGGLEKRRVGELPLRHTSRTTGRSKYNTFRKALSGLPEILALKSRLRSGFYQVSTKNTSSAGVQNDQQSAEDAAGHDDKCLKRRQ